MRRPFRAAALAAISILGGLTMFGPAQSPSGNPVRSDQQVLDEIVNYRSWEQVNDEPILVPAIQELPLSGRPLNLVNLQASVSG